MKKKKMKIITTDLQLRNCIESKANVEIWVNGFFDGIGVVLDFDSNSIKVQDGMYLRSNCTLKSNNYFRRID